MWGTVWLKWIEKTPTRLSEGRRLEGQRYLCRPPLSSGQSVCIGYIWSGRNGANLWGRVTPLHHPSAAHRSLSRTGRPHRAALLSWCSVTAFRSSSGTVWNQLLCMHAVIRSKCVAACQLYRPHQKPSPIFLHCHKYLHMKQQMFLYSTIYQRTSAYYTGNGPYVHVSHYFGTKAQKSLFYVISSVRLVVNFQSYMPQMLTCLVWIQNKKTGEKD